MNVGQLGWVKLLPNPPSNGCGNDAPGLGALIIDVEEGSAEVAAVEGATIDDDPVSVEATALAVDEKVGLPAADEEVVGGGASSAVEPKRSPFCRRSRSTTGDGRRSIRIPPCRNDLPRPNL